MTIASNVKQCLSTLKGMESQLSTLALNSQDKNAKAVFHETMIAISEIKEEIQTRVYELERAEPQYKGS